MYSLISLIRRHSHLRSETHFYVAEPQSIKIAPACILPRYSVTLPQRGFAGVCVYVCAVIERLSAKTAELLLARCCGRLLKALTHFQVSSSPPRSPKHAAYWSSPSTICWAAVKLCMLTLGRAGCVYPINKLYVCCKVLCVCMCVVVFTGLQ